jgi:putative aldouronate transport system permease protein
MRFSKRMGRRIHDSSRLTLTVIASIVVSAVTLLCLVPFLIIISGSLTDNASILKDGYHLIPKVFSTSSYDTILRYPQGIIDAYLVTIRNTVVGTLLGLFCMTMAGYVLQRKDFKYRNVFSFLIYFTTIFGGGLVPWYILVVKYLRLQDSPIALIYPGLMSVFLIILMKNFIRTSVPGEMVESAKIDGAGEFRIYWSIVLPLTIPGLATVALFLSLGYWNDWFLSNLFITTPRKFTIQYYLFNMLNSSVFMQQMAQTGVSLPFAKFPTQSVKMAMAIIATGPVVLFYPFVQKYFVSGLTVGAVKG